MKLTDVEVSRPQIDHAIQVAGYFGTRRAVYEIPRESLDDYFPRRPHLTDTERHTLVKSNLKAIMTVMQQKCELEAWRETNRGRGTFWLLDFNPRDLQLSDHQLVADEQARVEGDDAK
jgi:hypothetical protein